MYCVKCSRIIDSVPCPVCGGKKVREPQANDPCFLEELDFLSTGMLEDVLKQNGIPFLKKNVMGAGMAVKVGPMLERSRFYVSFDHLPSARSLAEQLFSGSAEDVRTSLDKE